MAWYDEAIFYTFIHGLQEHRNRILMKPIYRLNTLLPDFAY